MAICALHWMVIGVRVPVNRPKRLSNSATSMERHNRRDVVLIRHRRLVPFDCTTLTACSSHSLTMDWPTPTDQFSGLAPAAVDGMGKALDGEGDVI